MAAPAAKFHYDPTIAAAAAQRFKSRADQRQERMSAADKGEYTKVESKERLASHVNRLLTELKSATEAPAAQESLRTQAPLLQDLPVAGAVRAADINDRFVERVIGKTRDFLAVQFFDRGAAASKAVCRIVTSLPEGEAFATGFLVTPRLLITNHHVFQNGDVARQSRAEFNYQVGFDHAPPLETFDFAPDTFFLTDQGLDFALVAVAQTSTTGTPLSQFGFCPLIGAEGKIITGRPVNIVQHPSGGPKQVVVRDNTLIDLPENGSSVDQYAYYEADTEPGSSGSPVFNDQWEVVALHHSGVPKTNSKGEALDDQGNVVPKDADQTTVAWIANEGIRTSRLVRFINAAIVASGVELKKEFIKLSGLSTPPLPVDAPEHAVQSQPARQSQGRPVTHSNTLHHSASAAASNPRPAADKNVTVSQSGESVSITVPLNITLSFGPIAGSAPSAFASRSVAAPTEAATALLEQARPDPLSSHRPGFDPNFLEFEVPLPELKPAVQSSAAQLNDGGIELKYFHFSVIMNARRKLAFVSAVNLDTAADFQVKREGKDHWYYDERISHDAQAGPELYADNPLDFGHLTRRQDAAWGKTEAEATSANNDTFHLTNCSPQHSIFNQSSLASHNGLLLWGNLEMYVTAQAKKGSGRLSIFNGPVFRDNDQVYRGILLPKEFWKLIAYVRDDGKPGAVAFVLSQESLIRNLAAEDFVVGPYRPFQVKISDLEKRTNLDFGKIESYDAMHTVAQESLMENVRASIVAIGRLSDIKV